MLPESLEHLHLFELKNGESYSGKFRRLKSLTLKDNGFFILIENIKKLILFFTKMEFHDLPCSVSNFFRKIPCRISEFYILILHKPLSFYSKCSSNDKIKNDKLNHCSFKPKMTSENGCAVFNYFPLQF